MTSEAKTFYKQLVSIVGPMALQNLISALVNSVDMFMLGSVGQTAIAASAVAGNVPFILFMISTGLSSGKGSMPCPRAAAAPALRSRTA